MCVVIQSNNVSATPAGAESGLARIVWREIAQFKPAMKYHSNKYMDTICVRTAVVIFVRCLTYQSVCRETKYKLTQCDVNAATHSRLKKAKRTITTPRFAIMDVILLYHKSDVKVEIAARVVSTFVIALACQSLNRFSSWSSGNSISGTSTWKPRQTC